MRTLQFWQTPWAQSLALSSLRLTQHLRQIIERPEARDDLDGGQYELVTQHRVA